MTTVPLMDGQKIAVKTEVHKIETAIVQYSIDTAIVIAVTRSSTFSVAP